MDFDLGTPEERRWSYPCDAYLPDADDAYFRGIHVGAPPAVLFVRLCHLRVAPYSYDWVDNYGHRSPRQRVAGIESLNEGQRVMTVFRLVEFETNRQMTLLLDHPGMVRLVGTVAVSYILRPTPPASCRLVVKLRVRYPVGPYGRLVRHVLPIGDMIMMRKQLLTLKSLAEHDWRAK